MDKNIPKLDSHMINHLQTTGAGYDILRYICLPDLLGPDAPTILYTMGKNLARKSQFDRLEDIQDFFQQAGWGDLKMIKEKRREMTFELTGDSVSNRVAAQLGSEYRLEAGFLAEAIQLMKDVTCECIDEIKEKKKIIQFNVVYTK
jgi:predicted hydrocarbon binding protein